MANYKVSKSKETKKQTHTHKQNTKEGNMYYNNNDHIIIIIIIIIIIVVNNID
jgi:hypothetical protein